MQPRMLIGASAATIVALALGACLGGIDGGQLSVVDEHLQFVAKKREWLISYDTHCNDCFDAFVLCQKGAVDDSLRDTCQLAMDTCVRGGLISDASDAGADILVNDANDAGNDMVVIEDSGAGEGVVLYEDGGTKLVYEDSGAGPIVLHSDGGRRRSTPSRGYADVDAGAGALKDAGVADQDAATFDQDAALVDVDAAVVDNDASVLDSDAGAVQTGDAKAQLLVEVEGCLAQAHVCTHARAKSKKACVDELHLCVQAAIDGVFASICTDQLAQVQTMMDSAATVHGIQALCSMDLAR